MNKDATERSRLSRVRDGVIGVLRNAWAARSLPGKLSVLAAWLGAICWFLGALRTAWPSMPFGLRGFVALGVATAIGGWVLWRSHAAERPYDWSLPALLALIPLASTPLADACSPLRPLVLLILPALVALDLVRWSVPATWWDPVRGALAGRRAGVWVWVVLVVFYSAIALYLLQTRGFGSGDEGHYLLQAVSLWEDGDLDLLNNLGDRFRFTREAFSQYHIAPMSREGQAHSFHPFGLSLLILPGYALFGQVGATLTLSVIGALHGLLLFGVCRSAAGGDAVHGARAAVVFSLTMPVAIYAARAYPELAAGAICLFVYDRVCQARSLGPRSWLAVGLALGALPWLITRRYHVPFVVLNMAAALVMWRARGWRNLAAWVLPQIALIGLLSAINAWRFSGNNVFADFQGSGMTSGLESIRATVGRLPHGMRPDADGMIGIFVDRRFGLIWSNLFLVLLMPVAVAIGLRRWRQDWVWLSLFGGVYLLTCHSALASWTAGTASHPGRYLVAVLPFLALPLARWAAARPGIWTGGGVRVAGLCTALSLIALLRAPIRFECPYVAYTSVNPVMRDLGTALPWLRSFFRHDPVNWWHAVLTVAVLVGLGTWAFSRQGERIGAGAFFGSIVAAAVLLSWLA